MTNDRTNFLSVCDAMRVLVCVCGTVRTCLTDFYFPFLLCVLHLVPRFFRPRAASTILFIDSLIWHYICHKLYLDSVGGAHDASMIYSQNKYIYKIETWCERITRKDVGVTHKSNEKILKKIAVLLFADSVGVRARAFDWHALCVKRVHCTCTSVVCFIMWKVPKLAVAHNVS